MFDTGIGTDSEQADFLWLLVPVLEAAGWQHIPWSGPGLYIAQGDARARSGQVGAKNVEIHIHDSVLASLTPPGGALAAALNEIGIAAALVPFNCHSTTHSAIHVLIGPKQ